MGKHGMKRKGGNMKRQYIIACWPDLRAVEADSDERALKSGVMSAFVLKTPADVFRCERRMRTKKYGYLEYVSREDFQRARIRYIDTAYPPKPKRVG